MFLSFFYPRKGINVKTVITFVESKLNLNNISDKYANRVVECCMSSGEAGRIDFQAKRPDVVRDWVGVASNCLFMGPLWETSLTHFPAKLCNSQ